MILGYGEGLGLDMGHFGGWGYVDEGVGLKGYWWGCGEREGWGRGTPPWGGWGLDKLRMHDKLDECIEYDECIGRRGIFFRYRWSDLDNPILVVVVGSRLGWAGRYVHAYSCNKLYSRRGRFPFGRWGRGI